MLDFQKNTAQCIQVEAVESIKLTHPSPRFEIQTILQPDWAKWLSDYPKPKRQSMKEIIEESLFTTKPGLGEIPKHQFICICRGCGYSADDCRCEGLGHA